MTAKIPTQIARGPALCPFLLVGRRLRDKTVDKAWRRAMLDGKSVGIGRQSRTRIAVSGPQGNRVANGP